MVKLGYSTNINLRMNQQRKYKKNKWTSPKPGKTSEIPPNISLLSSCWHSHRHRGAHGQPCTVLLAKSWSRVWSPQQAIFWGSKGPGNESDAATMSSRLGLESGNSCTNPWKVRGYFRSFFMQHQKDPNLMQLWWNYSDVLWGWFREKLSIFKGHDHANKSNRIWIITCASVSATIFDNNKPFDTISANMPHETAAHMERSCLEEFFLFGPGIRVGLRATYFRWSK